MESVTISQIRERLAQKNFQDALHFLEERLKKLGYERTKLPDKWFLSHELLGERLYDGYFLSSSNFYATIFRDYHNSIHLIFIGEDENGTVHKTETIYDVQWHPLNLKNLNRLSPCGIIKETIKRTDVSNEYEQRTEKYDIKREIISLYKTSPTAFTPRDLKIEKKF